MLSAKAFRGQRSYGPAPASRFPPDAASSGADQQHQRLQRFAPHRGWSALLGVARWHWRACRCCATARLKRRCSRSSVTAAMALDAWRGASPSAASAASPCRAGAPGLRLRHQAPDALDKTPAAFRAGFGPFDVAFRRRVGQHEPADRVGAVNVDDRFRRDHVLLRLRHFLGRADRHRRRRCLRRNALPSRFSTSSGATQCAVVVLDRSRGRPCLA